MILKGFLTNKQASLLATGLHHLIHYSIIFWILDLNCALCLQQISEKENYHKIFQRFTLMNFRSRFK